MAMAGEGIASAAAVEEDIAAAAGVWPIADAQAAHRHHAVAETV
jgi:hypothetical protein